MNALTVDIGNTTIAFAWVRNKRIIFVWRIETDLRPQKLKRKLSRLLHQMVQRYARPQNILICSVVPQALIVVEKELKHFFPQPVIVVGRDVFVPIKNRYRFPQNVGQDRLLCAHAARMLYGTPLIVIDLGTAITFDAVNKKGEYLGGVIVPGLRLSAEALFLKTALLPQITIKAPRSVIGRDTQESILSGLFYGYGSLCQGLIQNISQKLKFKPKVVMTGGHTFLMKKFIPQKIRVVDEDLVFKGMLLLIDQNT